MAAVMAGRPIAGVLATYPSFLRTLWHGLGNAARSFFAAMRAKLMPGPEAGALAYHCSCETDKAGMSRWLRGVGLAIAF
eukprot:3622379-Lingulodinium_polyedra.AAC.1